jgi:hypothetical protein
VSERILPLNRFFKIPIFSSGSMLAAGLGWYLELQARPQQGRPDWPTSAIVIRRSQETVARIRNDTVARHRLRLLN